ncbi:hypothetical protein ACEQ8H_008459 [Pleosporales sp. CAS-2024a]
MKSTQDPSARTPSSATALRRSRFAHLGLNARPVKSLGHKEVTPGLSIDAGISSSSDDQPKAMLDLTAAALSRGSPRLIMSSSSAAIPSTLKRSNSAKQGEDDGLATCFNPWSTVVNLGWRPLHNAQARAIRGPLAKSKYDAYHALVEKVQLEGSSTSSAESESESSVDGLHDEEFSDQQYSGMVNEEYAKHDFVESLHFRSALRCGRRSVKLTLTPTSATSDQNNFRIPTQYGFSSSSLASLRPIAPKPPHPLPSLDQQAPHADHAASYNCSSSSSSRPAPAPAPARNRTTFHPLEKAWLTLFHLKLHALLAAGLPARVPGPRPVAAQFNAYFEGRILPDARGKDMSAPRGARDEKAMKAKFKHQCRAIRREMRDMLGQIALRSIVILPRIDQGEVEEWVESGKVAVHELEQVRD